MIHFRENRRVAVVLNKRAGALLGRDGSALVARMRQQLEDAGLEPDLHVVSPRRVDEALGRVLSASPAPLALLIGGGDGTIAAAIDRLTGRSVPLGILPLGTLNLVARDLLIPLDPEQALQALIEGVQGRIDMPRINDLPFLNLAVMGILPAITRMRERQRGAKSLVGWLRAGWLAFRLFKHRPRQRLQLERPGQPRQSVQTYALAVGNNQYSEEPGLLVSRDHLNDGTLSVHVARHRHLFQLLRTLIGVGIGDWRHDSALECLEADRLIIHSRRPKIHATVDGEVRLMRTPVIITQHVAALAVLVPRAAAGRIHDPSPSPLMLTEVIDA